MQRARRIVSASAAVAKSADANASNRCLYWFFSFLALSAALMAAEIRSEFATISALPRSETRAVSVEPQFVTLNRVTAVASALVPRGNDKD